MCLPAVLGTLGCAAGTYVMGEKSDRLAVILRNGDAARLVVKPRRCAVSMRGAAMPPSVGEALPPPRRHDEYVLACRRSAPDRIPARKLDTCAIDFQVIVATLIEHAYFLAGNKDPLGYWDHTYRIPTTASYKARNACKPSHLPSTWLTQSSGAQLHASAPSRSIDGCSARSSSSPKLHAEWHSSVRQRCALLGSRPIASSIWVEP